MNKLIIISLSIFSLQSCKKDCNCQLDWVNDCNLTYYPGDLIKHNGVCYKAFGQGTACMLEPGTTQGDIWEVCN